jgi:hypothetical protein
LNRLQPVAARRRCLAAESSESARPEAVVEKENSDVAVNSQTKAKKLKPDLVPEGKHFLGSILQNSVSAEYFSDKFIS